MRHFMAASLYAASRERLHGRPFPKVAWRSAVILVRFSSLVLYLLWIDIQTTPFDLLRLIPVFSPSFSCFSFLAVRTLEDHREEVRDVRLANVGNYSMSTHRYLSSLCNGLQLAGFMVLECQTKEGLKKKEQKGTLGSIDVRCKGVKNRKLKKIIILVYCNTSLC